MIILDEVLKIINYSGIGQGLFFAGVLFTGGKKRERRDYLLGTLLLVISFNIIHALFVSHHSASSVMMREPFMTLLGPLLFLYIRSFQRGDSFGLGDFRHFLLFIFFSLFQFAARPEAVQAAIHPYIRLVSFFWILILLAQFSFYTYWIAKISGLHDREIENEFSETQSLKISWAKTFFAVFMLLYLLLLILLVLIVHFPNFMESGVFNGLVALVFSVSTFVLSYRGVIRRVNPRKYSTDTVDETPSPSGSGLSVPEIEPSSLIEMREKVRRFMTDEKPYLDSEVTLSDLCVKLKMSRNTLSRVINSGFGQNFFGFINSYRVEAVKKAISDPKNEIFTLLSLAMDCGFNSKATFNHIFKQFTGKTPREYKLGLHVKPPDV